MFGKLFGRRQAQDDGAGSEADAAPDELWADTHRRRTWTGLRGAAVDAAIASCLTITLAGCGGSDSGGASMAREEHAVLLYIPTKETWPDEAELELGWALQAQLEGAIVAAGAGEFDGDEWGGGECVIYMYGPDADRLWATIEPVLGEHEMPDGSYAIRRYGGPGEGREERVELN